MRIDADKAVRAKCDALPLCATRWLAAVAETKSAPECPGTRRLRGCLEAVVASPSALPSSSKTRWHVLNVEAHLCRGRRNRCCKLRCSTRTLGEPSSCRAQTQQLHALCSFRLLMIIIFFSSATRFLYRVLFLACQHLLHDREAVKLEDVQSNICCSFCSLLNASASAWAPAAPIELSFTTSCSEVSCCGPPSAFASAPYMLHSLMYGPSLLLTLSYLARCKCHV